MNELRAREVEQNVKMREARDAADEANRAKSAFLAVVSHEIRTPMSGVLGMVRLLLETVLNPKQLEYAQTIQDSSDAMLALLNDILDFEKIEHDKMRLEHIDFDLHRLVQGVITLMQGHASAKKLDLKIEMEVSIPRYVIGDAVRLRQVLLNLVGNSIKFTTQGGVTLQIRTAPGAESTVSTNLHRILFSVKDTGIGISPEAQRNLFNPFSQADSSIARKFGGTGLGLAISQRLIEAMGGKIQIDSTPGEGAAFYFTLPMAPGNADTLVERLDNAPVAAHGSDQALRILIVEDNEINQRLLKEFVDRMGHQCRVAGSGEEALEILTLENFDMLLMDIELPGISGMGATKAIRGLADRAKAAVPVIALSGNVRDDDRRAGYAANMNGYLSKPVDPKRLKAMIDKVIKNALDNPVILEPVRESFTQFNQIPAQTSLTPPPLDPDSVITAADANLLPGLRQERLAKETAPAGDQEEQQTFAPLQELAQALAGKEMLIGEKPHAMAGVDIVFDKSMLDGLRTALDVQSLDEMITGLLEKTAEIIAAIAHAREAGDKAAMAAQAHDLKGMAANFGLTEISGMAAVLEIALKNANMAEINPLIDAMPAANVRAKNALADWRK